MTNYAIVPYPMTDYIKKIYIYIIIISKINRDSNRRKYSRPIDRFDRKKVESQRNKMRKKKRKKNTIRNKQFVKLLRIDHNDPRKPVIRK